MKLFWGLFLVLALAAGGLLMLRTRGGAPGAAEVRVAASLPARPATPEPTPADKEDVTPETGGAPSPERDAELQPPTTEVAPADVMAGDAEPSGETADAAHDEAETTDTTDATASTDGPSETDLAAPDAEAPDEVEAARKGTEPQPSVEDDADASTDAAPSADAKGTPSDERVIEPAATEPEDVPANEVAKGAPADAAAEPAVASDVPFEPGPGELVEPVVVESGALVLDGRHRVPGEGTREKPYQVGWDLLVALEQDYEPKTEGKKQVPEWVKALDGKHVAITGFVAFPFIAPTADECMVMLNQWDGCCIGVPPTPYDAVEVKLSETLDVQQGVPNYGTITGVFRTDPYLVNGWLIGLYVMDDAVLTKAGAKNAPGF